MQLGMREPGFAATSDQRGDDDHAGHFDHADHTNRLLSATIKQFDEHDEQKASR